VGNRPACCPCRNRQHEIQGVTMHDEHTLV
jgi:hypothetical protein